MELEKLELILKLMKDYKINNIKIDGVEVTKTLHDYPEIKSEPIPGLPTSFEEVEGITPWPKY